MNLKKSLFIILAVITLFPMMTSPIGLLAGISFALLFENPFPKLTKEWTPKLLQLSVIGLGAQMNLHVVAKVGLEGIGYTLIGITSTLLVGWILGRLFKTDRDTNVLITVGTAICGGSAIAAVAPAIGAKTESVTVSLATVFLLNSIALLLFPPIGHALHLSQHQFGMWSALAIHDTSSVVGASSLFGKEALGIATTLKLARALWIVPVTFLMGRIFGGKGRSKKPWFILGFLIAAALVTYFPALQSFGETVAYAARRALVLTLFLIGSSLSKSAIQKVGLKPLGLGISLWILVSGFTLLWLK